MTENEQQLLNAISEGDLQAFESLYRCHKDSLLTVTVVAIGLDRQSAEDVFMQLLKQAGRICLTNSLRQYPLSCCLNRGRDLLRRRQMERRAVEKYEPLLTDGSHPSKQLDVSEDQEMAHGRSCRRPQASSARFDSPRQDSGTPR
ncbi:MAG: hypothetical protein KDA80_02010 [Planctomycetaceae bacterium]|nr:hypothetical protein [Planctomycetaceae bacterium]